MRLRSAAALAIVASSLCLPAVSSAQSSSADDKAAARALGTEGQAALDAGDFAKAEDRFYRANKLYHAPSLLLGYARALRGEKKYVAAQEAFNSIIREGVAPGAPQVFVLAVEDAKKELPEVSAKVAAVTITVKAAGGGDVTDPQVLLDDKPVNAALLGVRKPVDPGHHVVKVTANGFKAGEKQFDVGEAGSADAALVLDKDPTAVAVVAPTPTGANNAAPTPPATGAPPATPTADTGMSTSGTSDKTLAWVSFGVGGAGLVVGAITGIIAMGDKSTLDSNCKNGTCPSSQQSNLDGYHSMGLISTIGFGVGVVGAGAGLYFLLTAKPSEAVKTGISPYVGPGTIGAVGRF